VYYSAAHLCFRLGRGYRQWTAAGRLPSTACLPEREFAVLPTRMHLLVRKAQAFQISLTELTGGPSPVEQPIFRALRGSAPDPEEVRAFLGVSLEDQGGWTDAPAAFREWRDALYETGVFIFKDAPPGRLLRLLYRGLIPACCGSVVSGPVILGHWTLLWRGEPELYGRHLAGSDENAAVAAGGPIVLSDSVTPTKGKDRA